MFYAGAFLLRSLRNEEGYHAKNEPTLPQYEKICKLERRGIPRLVEALKGWNEMINAGVYMEKAQNAAVDAAKSVGYSSATDMVEELEGRYSGHSVRHLLEKVTYGNEMNVKIKIPRITVPAVKGKDGNDIFKDSSEQTLSILSEDTEELKIFIPNLTAKGGLVRSMEHNLKRAKDDDDDEWKPRAAKEEKFHPQNKKSSKLEQQHRNPAKPSLSKTNASKKKSGSVRQRLSKKLFR